MTSEQIERVKAMVAECRENAESDEARGLLESRDHENNAADALEAMLAVVEKLPVSRDGHRVMTGTDMYHPDEPRRGIVRYTDPEDTVDGDDVEFGDCNSPNKLRFRSIGDCFVTEAAARAAAEKGGA